MSPGFVTASLCLLLSSGVCSCFHRYLFIDKPMTWRDARTHCRAEHADLATVSDRDDVRRLASAAGEGFEGRAWIGLHDKPWSWAWSLSNQSFYGEEEHKFRKWAEGEPDSMRHNQTLCVAVRGGLWHDYLCNKSRPFVCYDHTLGPSTTSDQRYVFVNQKKTWSEAQTYCRKHHTDLASVRNDAENQAIQKVAPADTKAAIGLSRNAWIWWSGPANPTLDNWAPGHPVAKMGRCATSVLGQTFGGQWKESPCQDKFPFICNDNKRHVFTVQLRVLESTTIDLRDPAVTAGILKTMKDKMTEMGKAPNIKVTWIKKPKV